MAFVRLARSTWCSRQPVFDMILNISKTCSFARRTFVMASGAEQGH